MKSSQQLLVLFFYFYFGCYLLLSLLNLSYIPVAWIDETFFLDPAIQFLKSGNYASRIWPQPGTETFFFAHLPVIGFLHILNLSVFPWDIFFVRLPFIFIFAMAMYYFYRYLVDVGQAEKSIALLVIFLFVNDRAVSESLRSVRTETIELLLLALVFWRTSMKKNDLLTAFFLSILFLTHPKDWVIVALMGLYLLFRQKKPTSVMMLGLVFLFPIFAFLAYGKFDFQLLAQQLFSHANEHSNTSTGSGSAVYNHFIERFWPFYLVQPYVPILFYGAIIISFYSIYRKKKVSQLSLEFCFLATNVYWYFTLGGFTRYNPILMLMAYALVFIFLKESLQTLFANRSMVVASMFLLPLTSFPFLSRHAAALIQREERDLPRLLAWYEGHLKDLQGTMLLVGESSAHYYAIHQENVDFTLEYSVHKFRFKDYDHIFACSVHPLEHPDLEKIAVYQPPITDLVKESGKKAITYDGTTLYRVKSENGFRHLQK